MIRNPMTDWMLPPEEEPGAFEQRWNVAPDRQKSVADVFKQAGQPYMDQYSEPTPQEVRRAYERSDAEARTKFADQGFERAGPDWLYDKAPDPFGGRFQAGPRVQRGLGDVGALGASFVIPQSLGDIPGAVLLPLKGVSTAWKIGALAAPHVLESDEAEAANLTPRQAMRLRKARAMGGAMEGVEPEFNPRATIGGNMPPENMRIAPEVQTLAEASPGAQAAAVPLDIASAPPRSWAQSLPRPQPAPRSTDIPDIRELPVDQAIVLARTQPHLIKSGERGEGLYVGGPRDVQSKATLNKIRRDFDAYIAADPRGGDWYDRYRAGLAETINPTPLARDWASKMQGQWSAGVDPGSELHFTLKELNSAIAGMPMRANYPAQHEAFQAALAARDPNLMQLGEKTGEYAGKVNPDQLLPPGATGVNDFRHARNFMYTEKSGEPQKGALGAAGHKFLDYETALAVDRANQSNLGGRSNWTGEQLQAAPWTRQKALDLMSRNPALTYEEAMQRALRTITDYFPKHTFFATHEAQPGRDVTGHMMGSVAAPQSVRDEFALDSRSNWATAPGARDAIYSGLGVEGTGAEMRVRPSIPMRGMYTPPSGETEFNIGQVARPLGTFTTGAEKGEPFKRVTAHDEAILNAGEALRGYIDAQNASAWHKTWIGGPAKESTSLFFPRNAPATPQEMLALRGVAGKYGMGDIVDTGEGITATQFYGGPPPGGKAFDKALRTGEFNPFGEPQRTRVDSGYIDYTDKWKAGVGSGEATRTMLDYVNQTPALRDAFNRNPYIADRALARIERDKDWTARWGAPREDIQKAREIIGEGPGWVDRIEAALKAGAILPATAAMLYAAASAQQRGGAREGS